MSLRMSRWRFGVAVVSLILAALPATAATISEFDQASEKHQIEFLSVKTNQLYQHYNSKPETRSKAACMEELMDAATASGSNSILLSLIVNEIDFARKKDPNKYQVEDIIFGVVETACHK